MTTKPISKNQADLLEMIRDGWVVIQPVDYTDKSQPYYIIAPTGAAPGENWQPLGKAAKRYRLAPATAKSLIERGQLVFKRTTNWNRWAATNE